VISLILFTAMSSHRKYTGIKLCCFLFFAGSGYWFVRETGKQAGRPVAAPASETPVPGTDSCLRILRQGDILLRTGNDEISTVFRHLNTRNQTYSHAGLVMIEEGRPVVYHCIGGADNPGGRLRRDEITSFINPRHNLGWGIVRLDLDSAMQASLKTVVTGLYSQGIRFDDDFDLASDERLYCTEFVYKSLIRASGDTAYLPVTVSNNSRYIAVDDLFNNKHAQTICELRYK
jgi:hypothetical protein